MYKRQEQAAEIERICFPPNEACSYEHMAARIKKAPDLFLVAVDREDVYKRQGYLESCRKLIIIIILLYVLCIKES